MRIDGFTYHSTPGADGVRLSTAVAGEGAPVVLLHGFPQTHLTWRHVAADLAADHTVVVPDLRGYGESDKPAATSPDVYSKRTMAADIAATMADLGFDRYAVVGHDRGALVAFRAALDHADHVTAAACLDVVPTLDMWDVLHGRSAAVAFHLFLMAQPVGLPEQMIRASADQFFGYFLDAWGADTTAIPADVRAAYLSASAGAVDSIVADYRASATIDNDHDEQDRANGHRITVPLTVVQQDWGAALGYDARAVWEEWAEDLEHLTVTSGHFMAEQDPTGTTDVVREVVRRGLAQPA